MRVLRNTLQCIEGGTFLHLRLEFERMRVCVIWRKLEEHALHVFGEAAADFRTGNLSEVTQG